MTHIVFLKDKKYVKGIIIEEKSAGIIIEIRDSEKLYEVQQDFETDKIKKWFIPFSNILYIGFI